MKYPLDHNEYNELIRILEKLLDTEIPLDWGHWTAEEQQMLYEAVEYIAMPYEKDLVAKEVEDE